MASKGIRDFLNTPAGKGVTVACMLGVAMLVFYSLRSALGASDAARLSESDIMFVDVKTKEPFKVTPFVGMKLPMKSPDGNESWPGELCYWTKDGKVKTDPTYVLLNSVIRPGSKDPTFCPDCHRLVVSHNPRPGDSATPPPTDTEWAAKHK